MFNPFQEHYFEMSPTEFEERSLQILKQQFVGLEKLEFKHDERIKTDDGNYQIDGVVRFEAMGVRFTVLVECKHYKSPISREKIQVLYDKIRAVGAHKGIFISTSSFQSGAIEYAGKHGIALIQITEADTRFEMRNQFNVIQAHPFEYNDGLPYIGIMLSQQSQSGGISCSHLRRDNKRLQDFMLNADRS
ncbi:MAG: restriction endonuclease [Clostridia bacterium]|nr:restriction endonuclease [Clostridia bacterium]